MEMEVHVTGYSTIRGFVQQYFLHSFISNLSNINNYKYLYIHPLTWSFVEEIDDNHIHDYKPH